MEEIVVSSGATFAGTHPLLDSSQPIPPTYGSEDAPALWDIVTRWNIWRSLLSVVLILGVLKELGQVRNTSTTTNGELLDPFTSWLKGPSSVCGEKWLLSGNIILV